MFTVCVLEGLGVAVVSFVMMEPYWNALTSVMDQVVLDEI